MGVKVPPGGFKDPPWGKGKDPPYEYVICFKKGCLPSTKPRLCSDKVWDLLQEKFALVRGGDIGDGKKCHMNCPK